eukprot:CAMPEP_0198302874 /NCGR_PEP_ID=MMETSP1449-20131203/56592_1 /TAXON_ID=420275 /ORGANISM="Attheya septentrionalis, Strain CCMP2084" /LENGTH=318 /DNA_ID=CAMNT_0044005347 /DNA_START=387 /DNA_END=1343 /DNA_ORIENTATION=+
MSRKEKRRVGKETKRLERKESLNQYRQERDQPSTSRIMSNESHHTTKLQRFRRRLVQHFALSLPGGVSPVTREHGIGFVKRLPVFVVLCFILNDDFDPNEEDHEMIRMLKVVLSHIQFPFSLDMMQGPSMLPTIHPTNDTLLRDPLSHRYFGRSWQGGDVVLFAHTDEDSKMKRYSCKRIVGLPGQQVNRHGEFMTQLYGDRSDLGVLPLPSSSTYATTNHLVDSIAGDDNVIIIPEGHVWLEGDNPLLSVDSRQLGPVSMSALKGRYILRLWPLGKQNWVNQKRPTPLTTEEMFGNEAYNLFSIPRKQSTLEESSAK